MASSKIKGFWKQQPTKAATDAVDVLTFPFSFNPTSATQISLGTLPNGARPIEVTSFGGATGGASPTVDIGSAASNAGFANELPAGALANGSGVLTGIVLTADTEVFGKVGASAATGGTVIGIIKYIMA